jgi:hypothetical protein
MEYHCKRQGGNSRTKAGMEKQNTGSVLPPENLRKYLELSVQAWTLYKVPQRYARYPNSCPELIKL